MTSTPSHSSEPTGNDQHVSASASASASASGPPRALGIALWAVQILTGTFLAVASGGPKIVGHASATEFWDQIGWDPWTMYVIGTLEILGGIALMIPLLASLSGLAIIALMIGAFITQLVVFDGENAATPVIIAVLAGFVAWGRRASLGRLAALPRRGR